MAETLDLPDLETVKRDLRQFQTELKNFQQKNKIITSKLNDIKLTRDKLNITILRLKDSNKHYNKLVQANILKLQNLHAQESDIHIKTMWFESFKTSFSQNSLEIEEITPKNENLEYELENLKQCISVLETKSKINNEVLKNMIESIK